MSMIETIEKNLQKEFNPQKLEIINESHLHAGHQPGFDGTGESHIRIRIVAKDFEGMNRLARHRKINALISEMMERGLHAVAIEAHAPGEETR
ncbi:MAG: BolA family transcriptional regulator [Rhizobiaceae bacterium]|nr:BolA family transcriptional regulator [Rhizobiaceae bacterium]